MTDTSKEIYKIWKGVVVGQNKRKATREIHSPKAAMTIFSRIDPPVARL